MFLFFSGAKVEGEMVVMCWGSIVKGSGEVIRASAPYTSGWGSFVLLKMDHVRVAQGGSLSMLHRGLWGLILTAAGLGICVVRSNALCVIVTYPPLSRQIN